MSETIYYHLVEKSNNKKTGPIAVLTSSFITCPDNCPFKRNGCYANGGPLRLHWDKVTRGERGYRFSELESELKLKGKGQKIRLFQAGDLPGINNSIHFGKTRRLVEALQNWKAFGYTHKPYNYRRNKDTIQYCNDHGVCINLSANNIHHADFLSSLLIGPVSVTLPKNSPLRGVRTPAGRVVVICPAVVNESISCSNCGGERGPLCSRINRDFIVGFPAHGSSVNKASEIANGT